METYIIVKPRSLERRVSELERAQAIIMRLLLYILKHKRPSAAMRMLWQANGGKLQWK